MKFNTDYFRKKRGLIALIVMIVALPVLVYVLQQQQELRQRADSNDEVAVYMTDLTSTTPLTTLNIPKSGQQPIRVFLDTRGRAINGYDVTITLGGNALPMNITEGLNASSFPELILNEFTPTDPNKPIRLSKVNTNPNAQISGVLHIATITFTSEVNEGNTGVIDFTKATVTSLNKTTGALLTETTNDVAYTIVAPPTAGPRETGTPIPGQIHGISGRVFVEKDDIPGFTAGDLPYTGMQVKLYNGTNTVVAPMQTAETVHHGAGTPGTFQFGALVNGTYTITLGMTSEFTPVVSPSVSAYPFTLNLTTDRNGLEFGIKPRTTGLTNPLGNVGGGGNYFAGGGSTPIQTSPSAFGNSLERFEVWRVRTNVDTKNKANWVKIYDFPCNNRTPQCSSNNTGLATWPIAMGDVGSWYVFINAFDYNGKQCSGHPLYNQLAGTPVFTDCSRPGETDVVTVNILCPSTDTVCLSTTPTIIPTMTLTPTPTRTSVPTGIPTTTLTPTITPTNAPNRFTIAGKVFVDTNVNHAFDAGEPGYTGGNAVITINGLPVSEGASTKTTTADTSGNYSFPNIPGGFAYTLFLAPPPAGWLNTTSPISLTVPPSFTTADFGLRQETTATPTPTVPACNTAGHFNPHGACVNNACVSVNTCGTNDCAANVDCVAPTTPAGNLPNPIVTIVTANACVTGPAIDNQVRIGWTNDNIRPVTAVEISSTANFTTYYRKADTGSINAQDSVDAPIGFTGAVGVTGSLTIPPNTTYYVRLFDGVRRSNVVSFILPLCATNSPTPTPACAIAGQTNPHGVCSGASCTSVAGCGVNQCTIGNNASCAATPTPTCAIAGQTNPHGVCSGASCTSTPSCGVNQCTIGNNATCVAPTSVPTATAAPTATPVQGGIQIALNLILQAIGFNDNPTPLHPQRAVSVQVFNSTNQMIADKSGTVSMNAAKKFTGIIDLGILAPGNYTVKVKSDKYLRRLLPGIQNLVIGMNTMPESTLVVGDVNNDNTLTLLDYNILRDCYQGINPLPMTNPSSKYNSAACSGHPARVHTDLDDNGIVNETDYNYFIKSLANQPGQ